MQYLISIAIVTRNRPDSLERTLESLSKQSVQPFEIIISDDSNSNDFIELNKEIADKFKCKYISGPQKGLYANRNFVAKNCTGTHIRTMDDDHEFPVDHFKVCLEAVKAEPDTIWTIGEYNPTSTEMSLPGPVPGQLHARGYSYTPANMEDYFGISCGASIYPRKVIDDGVLNVEIFKFGIVYLEYGARLANKKFKIKHLSNTYIIHHYDSENRSVSSMEIINGAQVFSMFMLSFHHKRSFKNIMLTTGEIIKGIMLKKYSLKLVKSAYLSYKEESNK
jgi:glycosyltransferase involved in cell wall biosynthesis